MAGFSAVMAIIFIADTATEYAIAAAVFYTTVVLAATRVFQKRTVVMLALVSVGLMIVSFHLTHSGDYEIGLINTVFSVVAIGITTYLGLKLVSVEAAAHEARERLLRIARVTTLGQLTASIAHEVSQPLVAISTSSSACRRWLAQDPPNLDKARAALDRIAADTDRASTILSRVRSLARGEAPSRSAFDFNEALLEIVDLSSGEVSKNGISLMMSLQDGLSPALADKVQIQQVIGNLILNAIEAVQESSNERKLKISSLSNATGIMFSISDSGAGIPPAARDNIFDAFWTTKKGGFGLGLTICRSIIEANGGTIWIGDSPFGGATILFDLPVQRML